MGDGQGLPKKGSEMARPLQPPQGSPTPKGLQSRGHRKPGVDNGASVVPRASAFLRHEHRRPGEGSEGTPHKTGSPMLRGSCSKAPQPPRLPPSGPPLPSTGPRGI